MSGAVLSVRAGDVSGVDPMDYAAVRRLLLLEESVRKYVPDCEGTLGFLSLIELVILALLDPQTSLLARVSALCTADAFLSRWIRWCASTRGTRVMESVRNLAQCIEVATYNLTLICALGSKYVS